MPKVRFSLDEQFSDQRSNEVAYKLTVENNGETTINLLSIVPRIPEEVQLLQVKDPSLTEIKTKYSELCAELTRLVKDQINYLLTEERDTKVVEYNDKKSGRLSYHINDDNAHVHVQEAKAYKENDGVGVALASVGTVHTTESPEPRRISGLTALSYRVIDLFSSFIYPNQDALCANNE